MFKGRISHSLMIKFYLWFLLTITLTTLIVGGFFFLISERDFEKRVESWAILETRTARDIVSNLFQSGLSLEKINAILKPLSTETHLSMVVLSPQQKEPLIALFADSQNPREMIPGDEETREILQNRKWFKMQKRGLVVVGLPIQLPSNQEGVFFLTLRKGNLRKHPHNHYQTPLTILAFLLVVWLLLWPLARHLARPLQQMARTADAFGQGDLEARIHLKRHGKSREKRTGKPTEYKGDEIQRLATSFNRMADSLKHQLISHKQLLADISHELRTPLTRLRVALELGRNESSQKGGEYLDRVEKQADELDSLINELLLFSQLESTPYQLKLETFAPEKLLEACAEKYQSQAEAVGVTLQIEPGGQALNATLDQRLIGRALDNVISNAVTHAPEGSTIHLACESDEHTGGQPQGRLIVMDEGAGVPKEMLERIFEPFVRADTARSRYTGGVGLGLAIARRCMEAHGGGIRAEPGLKGKGLRITLWWPLAQSETG